MHAPARWTSWKSKREEELAITPAHCFVYEPYLSLPFDENHMKTNHGRVGVKHCLLFKVNCPVTFVQCHRQKGGRRRGSKYYLENDHCYNVKFHISSNSNQVCKSGHIADL